MSDLYKDIGRINTKDREWRLKLEENVRRTNSCADYTHIFSLEIRRFLTMRAVRLMLVRCLLGSWRGLYNVDRRGLDLTQGKLSRILFLRAVALLSTQVLLLGF